MDGLPSQLPDDFTALKRLLQQQQRTIEQQRKDLDRKHQLVDRSQKKLNASEQRVERFREKVIRKQDHIERLEERLRRLLTHRFGRRSEKNADQFQLFNEAELLAEHADEAIGDEINVPAHTLCNDHARRRFHKVCAGLGKEQAADSIAQQGLHWYRRLYAIERDIKDLSAEEKHERRQAQAVPHWEAFIAWARQVQSEGVVHAGTREALSYLIKHAEALQRYCDDGRLPISNIQSEHVAKTIAIVRKNFLFADTAAGAESSGHIFSLIETARANGHHPKRCLSILLTELPNVTDIAQVEALLPWNLTPATVAERYAAYPAP